MHRSVAATAETDVLLSPPPVPDGEAPITITTKSTSTAGIPREATGKVLKPTVVAAVIDWNQATSSRCSPGIPASAASPKNSSAAPPRITPKVTARMILVVSESRRRRPTRFPARSLITMNPIAPSSDSALTIALTQTLQR